MTYTSPLRQEILATANKIMVSRCLYIFCKKQGNPDAATFMAHAKSMLEMNSAVRLMESNPVLKASFIEYLGR